MTEQSLPQESIFLQAHAIPTPAERAAYLDRACGDDQELRAEVEALLCADAQSGDLLDLPEKAGADLDERVHERPGVMIGPYQLLEPIGEGGFGIVFLAEQQHPMRRKVALKVLKPGMDTHQIIARFEAERQALALMDHPNIAKVLDAGTTGAVANGQWPAASEEMQDLSALATNHWSLPTAGRPYFVMELVQGMPITAYCDKHHLTPRERLELFVPVCHAVQHAHQKGIVHRDLKPSNVLIALYDGKPLPKVIDFGVAKATGPKLTERTLSTEFGTVVGTLEYMSPEQAELNQVDIDTRSDIYSLGVLLYELLTGTTPLDRRRLKEAALLEVLRLIREEEPPRPSTRLSQTCSAEREALNEQRAHSASRSALRAQRFYELDWIVMKCLEKERNRRYETANGLARDVERYLADEPVEACPPSTGYRLRKFVRKNRKLLGTAAAFLAVLLVGGVVTAWQAVRLARGEREDAQRVAEGMREQAKRDQEIHAALERARELREQARSAPGHWGKWAEAQAMARRAEALLESGVTDPALSPQVHYLLRELAEEGADRRLIARLEEIRLLQAEVNVKQNRYDRERTLPDYRQAFHDYGLRSKVTPPEQAAAILGRRPHAVLATLIAALDDWLNFAGCDSPESGWLQSVLAAADNNVWRQRLREARKFGNLKALKTLAQEVDVTAQPPQALFLLERALYTCGAKQEAIALLVRAQTAYPGDFWTNQNLGSALLSCHPPQMDDAIRFLTAAVALRPDSPGTRLNLGIAFAAKGRHEEAIAACRKAIALKPDFPHAHYGLGRSQWSKGRLDDAIASYQQAVEWKIDFAEAHAELGGVLAEKGRLDEAVDACRRALLLNPRLHYGHYFLGNALKAKGKLSDAIAAYNQAIDLKFDYAEAHCNLGTTLSRQRRLDEALAAFRRAIAYKPDLVMAHFNLGLTLTEQGRLGEAVAALQRVIDLQPEHAQAYYNLGNTYREQGRFSEATTAFRRAIEIRPGYAEAYCNLGNVLQRQGDFFQALPFLKLGHELGTRRPDWPYASALWIKECQRFGELELRLPAVLRGTAKPNDARERCELSRLCFYKKLYLASARLRHEAFAAEPMLEEDLTVGHLYEAACAAALAASRHGADAAHLDEQESSRWRAQALAWLRSDLALKERRLQLGKPQDRDMIRQQLRKWQYDQDLASLRESTAIALLPDDNQKACQALWALVESLLTKSAAPPE
ncbi:MAG: tetratricopeptide repeat protein [Gemmataceae bacterium]|nr:tetratricopeptide repeat protein [Gemmataceae bacterium]